MIHTGIVGATGYTGSELLRLLVGHPEVEIVLVTSRSEAGRPVADLFPQLRGRLDLRFTAPDIEALTGCDLLFFATPNGTAMKQVPELLAAGVRVVDLAADFRLKDPEEWERWYGMPHACPEFLAEAVYGLPEINRHLIPNARLVANPGCYPTAITLGFAPALAAQCIDPGWLIADAKSGVSGAGRSAAVATLMAEAGESFKAYAIQGHRHLPEIEQNLRGLQGPESVGITFVPHLLPMVRGIEATLYAPLAADAGDIQALYEDFYRNEPFVDVLPPGSHPETRSVRGANLCRIAVHRAPGRGGTLVVSAVIDNLVKGAAGQAVQNLNLMYGLPETLGLEIMPLSP